MSARWPQSLKVGRVKIPPCQKKKKKEKKKSFPPHRFVTVGEDGKRQ
jgi:hypothetical protein